jgi:hypothetical protein
MPPETVVYQDSDLNTVIYPTSSDSTLSPHFTTDRGVLLPGEDSVVEIMEEEDVDEYRLPPCDIIPLWYVKCSLPASSLHLVGKVSYFPLPFVTSVIGYRASPSKLMYLVTHMNLS